MLCFGYCKIKMYVVKYNILCLEVIIMKKPRNSVKFAGVILLIIGIATLVCGLVIFVIMPSQAAFITLVISVIINAVAISMLSHKT